MCMNPDPACALLRPEARGDSFERMTRPKNVYHATFLLLIKQRHQGGGGAADGAAHNFVALPVKFCQNAIAIAFSASDDSHIPNQI